MEALMSRQGQQFQGMEARLTRDGAREEGESNSCQRVNIGRRSLPPGDLEVSGREELA